MTRSPEANIRVDLLLIWSVLLVLTIWPDAGRALRSAQPIGSSLHFTSAAPAPSRYIASSRWVQKLGPPSLPYLAPQPVG